MWKRREKERNDQKRGGISVWGEAMRKHENIRWVGIRSTTSLVVWTGFSTFIWRLRRDKFTSGREIDNQNGYMES